MTSAERFLALFAGSDLAHGQTTVGGGFDQSKGGKANAKSNVVRTPLTVELIEQHLAGGQGKGAIPIRSSNDCRFGAIDVDQYDIDHAEIARRVVAQGMPLMVCRSKSGGAHLFLFLKDWAPAELVRSRLEEMAWALNFSGTEIFPKQGTIMIERGDVGNFINLPYNGPGSLRYAVGDDGRALTLEEFLDAAEALRVSIDDIMNLNLLPEVDDLRDYPPCLEKIMVALGPVTENRNITLFNYVVAAKKEDSDNWRRKLQEANSKYLATPLDARELALIERQHERKEYGFQCTVSPLKDYCRRSLCRKRRYGIGGEQRDDEQSSISGLTIVLADPRLYFLDVDGRRVAIGLDELMNASLFQRACVNQLQRMPAVPGQKQWSALVARLLELASTIDVPPELTDRGIFEDLLRQFCTGRVQAMHPEEVTLGKPYTADGFVHFKIEGLMDYLKQRDFTQYTRAQVQQEIKNLNNGGEYTRHLSLRRDDGSRTTLRVWVVPAYDTTMISLGEDNAPVEDVPF